MTRRETVCTRCGRVVRDQSPVCTHCAEELERALGDVAAVTVRLARRPGHRDEATSQWRVDPVPREQALGLPSVPWERPRGHRRELAAELATSHARQSRSGRAGGGSRPAERPVPWDDRASVAAAALRNALVTWARLVAEESGDVLDVRDDLGDIAAWLLPRVEWLRHHPDGASAVEDICTAVEYVETVVDRAPDYWYAGPCSHEHPTEDGTLICPEQLYVAPGARQVDCPRCGASWTVEERRKWLLAAAHDALAHAAWAARAITWLGEPIDETRIRQWKRRGRIQVRDVDVAGRPLYRIGDIIDLLLKDACDAAARETRPRDTPAESPDEGADCATVTVNCSG
jgi:hypothetical protein